METVEFKKLLFKTAFCVMTCDGDIDDLEVQEMVKIDKNTSYFNDIDLSEELDILVKRVKKEGKELIKDLFKFLRETKIDIVQELLLIEITIRMINADNRVDENEVKFLNLLRSKLDVDDQIISDRFGSVPYLNISTFDNLEIDQEQKSFISNVELPQIKDFEDLSINSKK